MYILWFLLGFKMVVELLNDELEYVELYRIRFFLFYFYLVFFIFIYLIWFYFWMMVYGVIDYFEVGFIVLVVIGIL